MGKAAPRNMGQGTLTCLSVWYVSESRSNMGLPEYMGRRSGWKEGLK